ncbi:helix-turn-helix transcriptional regulator [Streptomyces sp. NPDC054784]
MPGSPPSPPGPGGSESRRRELGAFLRSRRERMTPDEAGLPRSARRRTPGLRREELALLAGISATWYTYLEQARDIHPSEQVLGALATALRLDPYERGHLLELAGHAPAFDPRTLRPEPLAPEAAAVPLLLQPHPAYVIDGNYDVLAVNPAADALFPGLTDDGDRPANLVRWVFLAPLARDVLVDWEPEARGVLARLRTLAARHPDEPRYTRLVAELHDASPEVRDWWPRYDVRVRQSGRKRLRPPGGPVRDFAYTAFHLAEQPEQTLVVYAAL